MFEEIALMDTLWHGIWEQLQQFAQTAGNNQLISGFVLLLIGGILSPLVRKIWNQFLRFCVWLWVRIRGKETDHTFEQKYLEHLIDSHRYLDLIPAQVVTRKWGERQKFFDLEKIYVRLSISAQSSSSQPAASTGRGRISWQKPPSFISRMLQTFVWRWIRLFQRSSRSSGQTHQSGDLGLVIDRNGRMVISGDPGSGKTTLLKYLVVSCARARRKNKADGDSSRLVKERLLWDTRPFPILVTLRRHGKIESWGPSKGFIDAFCEELSPELKGIYPEGFFERRLRQGNCLILLDGFDELGSPQARAVAASRIASFLQIYDHPTQRIIVTTRVVGYEGQLDRYNFKVHTVQSLHAGEIRALVKLRYNAVALTEIAGHQPQEMRAIELRLKRRATQLIEKIECTPRLAQLAVNPMLLSLIVLIHVVKVELPDERILLYRDCVEILTERWQQVRLEAAGVHKKQPEELTLSQKLVLLREVAFAMQKKRQDEGSQALMPRATVRNLIAAKLPDLLGGKLPASDNEREAFCQGKANEWMQGIMAESGILVELGLDADDEPLVGFSHLTFQEYLAAEALNENSVYQPVLQDNLLHPAWREVVLLYEALVPDATPVITTLLASSEQPAGILLAGSCLAERLKKIQPNVPEQTLTQLKEGFIQATDQTIGQFEKTLIAIGGSEIITFARQQLTHPTLGQRLAAIRILGEIEEDDPAIKVVQADLLQIVETSDEVATVVAARESLALIGDPRFEDLEPPMVYVPEQTQGIPASPAWIQSHGFKESIPLISRMLDYMFFMKVLTVIRRYSYGKAFEIGKYPVTNIEYSRFIEATNHRVPEQWVEDKYPLKEASYPVTGITPSDAKVYCKWLSQQTGKKYRLPTEWEWEWAAAGPDGYQYPWGDQFDKDKCNTEEAGINETTPVGSYRNAVSWIKASDMCGNVWENTLGLVGC
jgi:hypothetical protein